MINKRLIVVLLAVNCVFSLFADNFEDSKRFNIDSVSSIDILLLFENLNVSVWSGNEIVVTSESSNKSLIPEVSLNAKNLKISSRENINDNKFSSEVSLMLPENFVADKITINTQYKKTECKNCAPAAWA